VGASWYIESNLCRETVKGELMCVVDGGSRGGPFAPFDSVSAGVQVIEFEPDADAADEHTVPKALWNRSGTIEIHLAVNRSASSVYPPNLELLRPFPDQIGAPARRTESKAEVEAISIDDAVERGLCPPPDFIKLDVHSAEYEALEGASRALESSVVAVLVETWHAPVHQGQHLHGDVERFLNDKGFHCFDHWPVAAWRYELDGEAATEDRPRLIAAESIFFKDFPAGSEVSAKTAVFAIAAADLYEYTNYAVHLSRSFAARGTLSPELQAEIEGELLALRRARRRSPSARGRLGHRLIRVLNGLSPAARRARRAIPPLEEWNWRLQTRLYHWTTPLFSLGMKTSPDVLLPTETHGERGGTYAIWPDGLSRASVVYSFGVGSDIAFDLSLIEKYGLSVHAFDPTDESAGLIAGQDLPERFHFHNWALADTDGEVAFRRLARGSPRYLPGTLLETGTEEAAVKAFRLDTIMRKLGHEHVDVVKLDIEGSEYGVIENIRESPVSVGQIVLELHPHLANLESHSLMIGRAGWKRTRDAIDSLRESGYELFHISDRGTEFSFRRR
jgi:FkbM family methyltransferase